MAEMSNHPGDPVSCFLEAQQYATKLDFIVVMQRRRRLRGELLPVEKREIGTVLILQPILAVLDKDARVHARDTALFPTVRGQVHIGEDVAHSILATDQNNIFAAQIELLVVSFDDEPRNQCCWGGSHHRIRRRRSIHRGGGSHRGGPMNPRRNFPAFDETTAYLYYRPSTKPHL